MSERGLSHSIRTLPRDRDAKDEPARVNFGAKMSSFLPDERSISGRIEITRNLAMMRKKILAAKPTLRTLPESEEGTWHRTKRSTYKNGGPAEGKATTSRPQSAKKNRKVCTFTSPPATLGLARVLSANRRKAQMVDYSHVLYNKNLAMMYSKIENMQSDLKQLQKADNDWEVQGGRKKFHTRVSIDWESGHINSAPQSPFSTKKKRTARRRPQSAPPQRTKTSTSRPKPTSGSSEKCRAYKEAIKDHIVENAIYEEERLQELFENYKREKQKENEDIVVRAIEELKLELNVA